MDCIFCKIISREIPSDVVYEDDEIMAFRDLNPMAPVHVLIIPKEHISSLDEATGTDGQSAMLGRLMSKIKEIAALLGLENGYRVVSNCGEDGMQTVGHLHFHLLGGRKLGWPPG